MSTSTSRPRTSRMFTVSAFGAAAALTLAACGGGTDVASDLELVTPGTLTVCSEVPYAPFEVEDTSAPSRYSGFDIDITQAIADNLELKLVVIDSGFDAIQSGTAYAADQCDMGASAITITPARQENLDFADPYYDSLQSLLTATDSGITSIADLAGKPVAVQADTTGESYAQENAPDAELISFPGDAEMWPALQAGNVVAILQDLPVNLVHTQDDPGYTIVEQYDTDESYGFAFAKDKNPKLLAAINEQLTAMRGDGSYDEIYNSYFSTEG